MASAELSSVTVAPDTASPLFRLKVPEIEPLTNATLAESSMLPADPPEGVNVPLIVAVSTVELEINVAV